MSDRRGGAGVSSFAGGLICGLALMAWLVIQPLADVLFVLFAAGLVALVLDALLRAVQSLFPQLSRRVGLALVLVLAGAAVGLFGLLVGPPVAEQAAELTARIPGRLEELGSRIEATSWGSRLRQDLPPMGDLLSSGAPLLGRVPVFFSNLGGALTAGVFVLLAGIFAAANPEPYLGGAVRLVPPSGRERAREVLTALGTALRWWLAGRLGSMVAVGVLTSLGLALLGIPLSLALGVIAGLFSFVPFLGPIASAIPALLVALGEGPTALVGVLAVYGAVQFLEGNFVTPLIQERAVSLPPAALLASQFVMGVFFGLVGVIVATPLTVAGLVLVQMLYLQQALGEADAGVLAGDRGDTEEKKGS